MNITKILVLLAITLIVALPSYADESEAAKNGIVTITDGFIRETIPGTNISSAYLTITNHSHKDVVLVAASGDFSPRIEIHEHSLNDGMMRMRQLESITIDANSSVKLQPYGLHLMLFDLKRSLKHNESADITLHFSSQPKLSITLPIQSIKQKNHH